MSTNKQSTPKSAAEISFLSAIAAIAKVLLTGSAATFGLLLVTSLVMTQLR
jgi:hypothetical protein